MEWLHIIIIVNVHGTYVTVSILGFHQIMHAENVSTLRSMTCLTLEYVIHYNAVVEACVVYIL